jgi:2'-hydroxyisoflavone reductase
MRLLVIGGTRFLGKHLVPRARAAGHDLTVFHRGMSGCSGEPGVEHLHGDRQKDLDLFRGRSWDAVVDTCGFVPRVVRASAEALAGSVDRYVFVSSISVYREFRTGMTENDDVARLADPTVEEITGETYGGLKSLCEEAVEAALPGRSLHVRAGLIVGPDDYTDRFTYWVRRISTGGEVLVPEPGNRPVQMIHVDDLAAWMLRMIEAKQTGVYHATTPDVPWTFADVLGACREVSGSKAEWVWVPEKFLLDEKVVFWQEIPLCIPEAERALLQVGVGKAVREGLTWRPLLITARETLAWDARRPPGTQLKAGLTAERETELLRTWRERG